MIYESVLDDMPAVSDAKAVSRISSGLDQKENDFLVSADWYKYWMDRGCWQLFLLEIPVYPSVDFISEFRKMD